VIGCLVVCLVREYIQHLLVVDTAVNAVGRAVVVGVAPADMRGVVSARLLGVVHAERLADESDGAPRCSCSAYEWTRRSLSGSHATRTRTGRSILCAHHNHTVDNGVVARNKAVASAMMRSSDTRRRTLFGLSRNSLSR
jgi:hypothetical protein